jgi:hypothetical protein
VAQLPHLLYFWSVAKHGSIVRASEELHLAHPTISGQIHRLEEVLAEKLFARRGRNLALTEAGRGAFRYADEIFSLGRQFVDTLKARASGKPLRLVVGVAPGVGAVANGSGFATASFQNSSSPFGPPSPHLKAMELSSRRPPSPTVSDPVITDDERVDQAGLGSFPASDPPPWTSGREWRPRQDLRALADPDGGGARERARRRRHID